MSSISFLCPLRTQSPNESACLLLPQTNTVTILIALGGFFVWQALTFAMTP
jgi:hypothetical protein